MAKQFSNVELKIEHIPFHELAFVAFNDAAWANARGETLRAGGVVFATQRNIFKGEPATISI
eukprot:5530686-Pyramimonas_sp.AAC.1